MRKYGLFIGDKNFGLCNDDELNELDEYVFSVRKDEDFDYNENQLC